MRAPRPTAGAIVGVAFMASVLSLSHPAPAGELAGMWTMSPLTEAYTIASWPDTCGPIPSSGTLVGGGTVRVVEEGKELVVLGATVLRTDRCLDPNPGLLVESHGGGPRAWTTRCASPAGDARRATVTAQYSVQSLERIVLSESGRYELVLAQGSCIADVGRFAVLTRKLEGLDAAPPPSASIRPPPSAVPSVAAPSPKPCVETGEASRLEIRPSRKLLRPGEQFAFRAHVTDESGCPTAASVGFRPAPENPADCTILVDDRGLVRISSECSEGSYAILATVRGHVARVVVEVANPSRYEELRAREGLNDAGENEDPVSVRLATSSLGSDKSRVVSRSGRNSFLLWVAGLGVIFGLVSAGAAYRSRRRGPSKTAPEPPGPRAPTCPKCARELPEDAKFCPDDGTKIAPSEAPPVTPIKVCSTCGTRYQGGSDYCGRDGTRLVVINRGGPS